MKKLILLSLIFLFLATPALAETKQATLINGANKVVVSVGSAQAQHYFGLGYVLYNGNIGTAVESSPALFKTNLALPISSTASSATLVSGTTRDGTLLNGNYCFTIDGNISTAEYVCGTASGTALTNLTRGIGSDGVTSFTALKFSHRYGAEVKITDFPVLQRLSRFINGDSKIPNKISYADNVIVLPTDSTSTLANIDYVNNVATSGAANISETVKGIGELATGDEAASSTSLGGTGARLVIPTSITTSTAGVAKTIPVTGTNGLIAPGFYQGNDNVWSGTNTFSGITTINNGYAPVNPATNTSIVSKVYVDFYNTETIASDILKTSAGAGVNVPVASTTYFKAKEIVFNDATGTVRVKFTMIGDTPNSKSIYGKIYKNGVAYGTEQSTINSATKSEDLSFVSGDIIQLYVKMQAAASNAGTVSGFNLYYSKTVKGIDNSVNLN